MSLPSGISTCLVTFGRATSFVGSDATISGKLTADRAVVWEATGTRLMSGDDILPAENNESLSFSVPHVDQDGFVDAASVQPTKFWTYTLTATITLNGTAVTVTRDFQPLVGQTTLDLDLVPDGETTPGVTAPFGVVTSISGLTGDVTFDEVRNGIGLDTGWHILTGLDVPSTPDFFAYYRRIGNQVTFVMGAELGAVTVIDGAIPTALLPDFPPNMDIGFAGLDQSSTELVGYLFTSTGAIYSTNPSGFGNSTSNYFTWTTSQPFPAMPYPGTPA